MSKREGELKSRFGAELLRQAPGFQILQYSTNGAPDREIIGCGISTRWEFKHGTPDFKSPGDQELVCCRIAAVAHCRYVIWQENARGEAQRTLIVHPRRVMDRVGWNLVPNSWCQGFDMKWLVRQVLEAHRR